MSRVKQPYIPLYTGDYIKDTRMLSLAAKGAWSDIILFMWAQETKGILEGTIQDFARLIGGSTEEVASVLLELCSKKICDGGPDEKGFYKIICRRLVKEAAISEVRSESGSKGGSKTQANSKAKTKQKSEYDNDIDNDNEFKIQKESEENSFSMPDKLQEVYDDITRETLLMHFRQVDVDAEWEDFKVKVKTSEGKYDRYDVGALRLAFNAQLRTAKKKPANGKVFNKNNRDEFNQNEFEIIRQHTAGIR